MARPPARLAKQLPAAPGTPLGIITAVVAVTGIEDQVADLIQPGAFTRTFQVRRPKVVMHHEWKAFAGRVLHVIELAPGDSRLPKTMNNGQPWPKDAGAVVATMQFNLATQSGRDAYEWAKFYSETNECEWSIGYKVVPEKCSKRRDGVRVIYDLDVFEFSLVLFGAAKETMTVEVKDLDDKVMQHKTFGAVGMPGSMTGAIDPTSALAALMEAKALPAAEQLDDPDGPTHAGLVVVAGDTGRILMLQRSIADPDDPAGGTWEFPGGGIEPGETPMQGAEREWSEETGHDLPEGEHVDSWDSPNGVYRGHVYRIASENDLNLNPDHGTRDVVNPDDPKGKDPEVTAWWSIDHAKANPALRKECADTPWPMLAKCAGGGLEVKDEEPEVEEKAQIAPEQTAAYALLEVKAAAKYGHKLQVRHRPSRAKKCQFCGKKDATVHRMWHGGSYRACPVCDHTAMRQAQGQYDAPPDTAAAHAGIADAAPIEGKTIGGPHDTSPIGTPGGRQNWVDKVAGLPAYIREIGHALIRSGHDESSAVALAVAAVKRWAAGADGVTPETQAKAAKAVAEWEAKKAAAHTPTTAHTGTQKLETKTMANMSGSFEERDDLLRRALRALLCPDGDDETSTGQLSGDCWVSVEGTFPDHVVATRYDGNDRDSYEIPYSITPEGQVTLGVPVPCRLSVVAAPGEAPDVTPDDDDALDARFVDPAVTGIDGLTSLLMVAPDLEQKAVDSLRAPVLRLLDALAVKGMDVSSLTDDTAEAADDEEDPWAGLIGDTDDPSAPADETGDDTDPDADAADADDDAEHDDDPELEGKTLTLDPADIAAELAALAS